MKSNLNNKVSDYELENIKFLFFLKFYDHFLDFA